MNLNTLLLLLFRIFVSGKSSSSSSSSSQAPISSFYNFRHSSDRWVVSQLQHKILRYLKSFPLMRPLLLLLLFPSTSSSTYLHVCVYLSVCLCGWVCGCVFLSLSLFHFKSPISKRAETRFSLSSPLCPRLLSLPPPVSLSVSVSNLSVLPSTRKKRKIIRSRRNLGRRTQTS
jgi:hypothetical protein